VPPQGRHRHIHHRYIALKNEIKMKLIFSILAIFIFNSLKADVPRNYIFKFSYESQIYYYNEVGIELDLKEDKNFYYLNELHSTAEEVLIRTLKSSTALICYKEFYGIDVAKFKFYDDEILYFLEDTATINFINIDSYNIEFLDVIAGNLMGQGLFTEISEQDKLWIETNEFQTIRNLEIELCSLKVLANKELEEEDLKRISELNQDTDFQVIEILADELKSKGVLILSFCSC
jgi:hypothetical protein